MFLLDYPLHGDYPERRAESWLCIILSGCTQQWPETLFAKPLSSCLLPGYRERGTWLGYPRKTPQGLHTVDQQCRVGGEESTISLQQFCTLLGHFSQVLQIWNWTVALPHSGSVGFLVGVRFLFTSCQSLASQSRLWWERLISMFCVMGTCVLPELKLCLTSVTVGTTQHWPS